MASVQNVLLWVYPLLVVYLSAVFKIMFTGWLRNSLNFSSQLSKAEHFNVHLQSAEQRTITQKYRDWYTGC